MSGSNIPNLEAVFRAHGGQLRMSEALAAGLTATNDLQYTGALVATTADSHY